MTADALDRAGAEVLRRVERAEALYRATFALACVVEALLLGALLWATDLSDRTHLLLLIGFVGGYTVCVLAVVALGAHVTRLTQGVLRALELREAGSR
jgi:hypothetical protein